MGKNRAKKDSKKKYLKTIAIIDIFILTAFIFCYSPFPPVQESLSNNTYYFKIIAFLIIFIILIDLLVLFKVKDDIRCEKSINFVNTYLSVSDYTEVIPKRSLYYDHSDIDSENISNFFAIVSEEDNMVIIIANYENEVNIKFFESFPKEMFTRFYELKK